MIGLIATLSALTQTGAAEGLWIGDIHACRGTIVSASLEESELGPAVLLVFRKQAGVRLAWITRARVGRSLNVVLDGRILTSPVVNEPILGGQLWLQKGGEERVGKKIVSAVARPCAGDDRT